MTILLDTHVSANDLGLVGDEKLLVCLTRNDDMPDVVLSAKERASAFQPDQSQFPAPDFAAESPPPRPAVGTAE